MSDWEEYETNDPILHVKTWVGVTEFVIQRDSGDVYFKLNREAAIQLAHQIIRYDWTP